MRRRDLVLGGAVLPFARALGVIGPAAAQDERFDATTVRKKSTRPQALQASGQCAPE